MKTAFKRFRIGTFLSFLLFSSAVLAQVGTGVTVSENMVLTPEVNFTLGYTDNVAIRSSALSQESLSENSETEEDGFLVSGVALNLTRQDDAVKSTARAWYDNTSYFDNSQLDGETYGANGALNFISGSGKTSAILGFTLQHVIETQNKSTSFNQDLSAPVDFTDSAIERVERDILGLNAEVAYDMTAKAGIGAGYDYSNTMYESETYRDQFSHRLSGFLTYQISSSIDMRVTGGADYNERESTPAYPEDYEGEWDPYFTVGVDSTNPFELTEKITLTLDLGYETRTQTSDDGSRSSNTDGTLTVNGRLNFDTTGRVQFFAVIDRGYTQQASSFGSDREELEVGAGVNHKISNTINHTASVTWQDSEYLDSAEADGEPQDSTETLIYNYRIGYTTPSPWFSLYANISYEDGSSNFGVDYSETQASLTAAFRY